MKAFKSLAQFFYYLGSLSYFARDTIGWIPSKKRKIKDIIREIVSIGIDNLPLVSLISFFIGIIIAFQTAYQLRTFRSEIQLAALVALSMVRELGPVVGALIVAARSGASITAGIGSMKISEQVDALEVFGVNPLDYLVVPKFLALFICMPILTIYANFFGIIGGYLVGTTEFAINSGLYFRMTFDALSGKDILSGMVKSLTFGSLIAFISCYEGFRPLSSIDVSRSVTHSVVRSFVMIIVFDFILTALFYFINA